MSQGTLLDQILSGQNRQLQVLAASGLVPLPAEELIPLQVAFTRSPDSEVAGEAAKALQSLASQILVPFVRHQAEEPELTYFGRHLEAPAVLAEVIRRRDVPRALLVEMAQELSPQLQEILIDRQDAILDEPLILVSLEKNPSLSSYTRRRIWEYREHLLPKEKVPPKKAEELLAEADSWTDEEVQEAIDEARERAPEGPSDDQTELSEGQIKGLPLPVRIKMARSAGRQLRGILIRDTNAQVALTVMRFSSLSEQEVEQIALSRAVVQEVLDEIPKRRDWIRKYSIVKALVRNPRTLLPTALKLMPRLRNRDMRDLARDKNVPQAVRANALRQYQARQ